MPRNRSDNQSKNTILAQFVRYFWEVYAKLTGASFQLLTRNLLCVMSDFIIISYSIASLAPLCSGFNVDYFAKGGLFSVCILELACSLRLCLHRHMDSRTFSRCAGYFQGYLYLETVHVWSWQIYACLALDCEMPMSSRTQEKNKFCISVVEAWEMQPFS